MKPESAGKRADREPRKRRQEESRVHDDVPERQEERPIQWPEFAARRKKIFGDRILPGADLVIEDRERY